MKTIFSALFCVILFPTFSFAGYQLTWSSNTATAQVGNTISVDLILSETTTSNINQFGVAGALFSGTSNGFGTMSASYGASFDALLSSATQNSPSNWDVQTGSFLGAGIGSNSVVLGSFSFTSGIDGNGTLNVVGLTGADDDISVYVDNIGTPLPVGTEAFASGPGTFSYNFTVTAVPEPTSIVGGSLLGVLGIWVARRKRLAKANAIKK